MDFVLALLPWQVIWKLQMKRNEKLGVALAMSMGILSVTLLSNLRKIHLETHRLQRRGYCHCQDSRHPDNSISGLYLYVNNPLLVCYC